MNNADAKQKILAEFKPAVRDWYNAVGELASQHEAEQAAARLADLQAYVEDLAEDHILFRTLRWSWERGDDPLLSRPEFVGIRRRLEVYGWYTADGPESFCKRLAHEVLVFGNASKLQYATIDACWLLAS